MSSNQIGGFFNRLEASRKYLFASVGVLGAAGSSIISGALILRGQEVKPVIEVAPDWESYAYVKLDLKGNEEDKKFFEAALAWDLEIDGKKWADGKNVSFFFFFVFVKVLKKKFDSAFLVQVKSSYLPIPLIRRESSRSIHVYISCSLLVIFLIMCSGMN